MNPSPEAEELPEDVQEREDDIQNLQLKDVLEFYDSYDLLPYANHILWLSAVKNAVGNIPFDIGYEEICCLVILNEEINKKAAADARKLDEKSSSLSSYVTPQLKR